MAFSITELIIVIIIIFIIFVILAACCRGLRRAYEDHFATEELARRRQAFFLNQAARTGTINMTDTRSVRVTTISTEGDTIAMGVYEIHVPRRDVNNSEISRSTRHQEQQRHEILEIPPPPFSTAYQVSSRIPPAAIDKEEPPPPAYDDLFKTQPNNHRANERY